MEREVGKDEDGDDMLIAVIVGTDETMDVEGEGGRSNVVGLCGVLGVEGSERLKPESLVGVCGK